MAIRFMVDSDTLNYVMKGRDTRLREKFSKHIDELSISSVTYAEIAYGLNKRNSGKYQAVFDMLTEVVQVSPWTRECADEYAMIRADLERAGTPIGAMDMMIAATAKSAGVTLITNNTAHFGRVSGLKLDNWSSPQP